MKSTFLAILCVALAGCTSISVRSRNPVRREVAVIVKEERWVEPFERRLEKLGATFERSGSSGEKTAFVPLPAEPDFLPPRRLTVEYRVGASGEVQYIRARDVTFSTTAKKA